VADGEVQAVALQVLHPRIGGDAHIDPGWSRVNPARRGISQSAANELVVVTESGRRLPDSARSRSVAARIVESTCAADA